MKDLDLTYFLKFTFISFFIIVLCTYYLNNNHSIRAVLNRIHSDSFEDKFVFSINTSISLNQHECNPFISNATKFSIRIDGQDYPKSIPLSRNSLINYECLNKNRKLKLILLWNTFFDSEEFYFGLGKKEPFIRHRCPVVNCEITRDRSRLIESDVVLTHMRNSLSDLPAKRSLNQRWVFMLMESPVHSSNFESLKSFYNLTATYRINSDFPGAYEDGSDMHWALNKSFSIDFNYHSTKIEFAAAVISNCGASSNRLNYIKQLQRYIKVDVFGKCGKKCPEYFRSSKQKAQCKEIIAKEYMFYFSFENSICTDYITEKFFEILKYDIVPVVLGGGTYDYYIPKTGFINVMDYKSPKELATYLYYLSKNKEAYNSYFKWKKYVQFGTYKYSMHYFCNICIQLQLEEFIGVKKSIINDIAAYWSKEKHCRSFKF